VARALCLFFLTAVAQSVFAATHLVDSIAALKARVKEAVAGDTIILKNGTYATTGALTVSGRGAPGQPITIAADTIGEVEISGTHGFNIVEPAAHIVVSGFKFTHAAGKNGIGAGTSHVRFTRNTFQCVGDGPYLNVLGDDPQIDYNEFRDKKTIGSMIAVGGSGSQVARRVWIHHNYFHDFASTGGTAAEMIRFGLTALALSTGAGIVEHNLFVRCRGENEFISSRSGGNTYRYNTFIDSPSSQMTLRHGNECLVYGNIFRNTEGLRIYGDRHQVFSNYFEGNYIGVSLGNGSTEVIDGGAANGHDRPDHCVIAFNTFIDNRTHYQMSRRAPDGLGATHTTFANNILHGRGIGAKIEGPNTSAVWEGNVLWTAGGAGDLPAESYMKDDPMLAVGPDGTKRPQPGSFVFGSASGNFPTITWDVDGQPRPEKKSKGADEPGNEPAVARLLVETDVGPLTR
jgi:hypothetical protein